MKRITSIVIIVISILLVGLYTVASTYSVIINVIEKDGINEIVNEINIKDLLTNDNGTYNQTYYDFWKIPYHNIDFSTLNEVK